jgi:type IV pilus assembly protein PilA
MQNRKGFTLIELLIVVVIIGILAAIAIPKFANTKEKAYVAAMKSDLRNLVTAQEAYFADNDNVYADQAAIEGAGFTLSTGVSFTSVTPVAGTGWGAQVQHSATTQVCGIAVGDGVNPVDNAANEGEPTCAQGAAAP